MSLAQVRRRERVIFLALVALLLVPAAAVAHYVDLDRQYVTFLKWIDDREGIVRGSWADQQRTESEAALFREVERVAADLTAEFTALDIPDKWAIVRSAEMAPTFRSFTRLLDEGEVRISGVEIDYTQSEVSANVGALALGFRNAVADLMWVQVNVYWLDGLVNRMLPLMYTVVKLDPQFIDAYSVGGWHLSYNIYSLRRSAAERSAAVHEAIDFLEDGLRKNPRSAQLYEDLGFSIYYRKLNDLEQAEVYLGQGIQFEPHEPRMERAAALMTERQRREREALKILQDYDKQHPDWVQHKVSMERLRRKLQAREYERVGDLEAALAIWDDLDEGLASEPVAPLERVRLGAMIEARDHEAAGDPIAAREALLRARSSLPKQFYDDLPAEIDRLTERITALGLADA